jgi:hypothetical protein
VLGLAGASAILTEAFVVFLRPSSQCRDIPGLDTGDHFLPNPFQFIVHLLSYHSMLCNLTTDRDIKISTETLPFVFTFVDAGHDYASPSDAYRNINQKEGGMSVDAGGDGQMKLQHATA